MTEGRHQVDDAQLSVAVMQRIDDALEKLEVAWQKGSPPELRMLLADFENEARVALLRNLLEVDVQYRRQNQKTPTLEFYQQLLPEYTTLIEEEFSRNGWDKSEVQTADFTQESGERPPNKKSEASLPQWIDRFQVHELLGGGGFGLVYRCSDPGLKEEVAVKILRPDHHFRQQEINAFLNEARSATRLRNHPNIVRVREAQNRGQDSFIVSDYIDGNNLADRMAESSFTAEETAALITVVAEALHHAHQKGIVHRDVKPGNILLDDKGIPYLTDFGMAASEDEQFSEGTGIRGTPAYLSPEQARGDSHLAGPTADVFSLGVVFYEMLAGKRPFWGTTRDEILEKIKSPQPPRSIRILNDQLPEKLEEICLKCLRKNPEERYTTAKDLAQSLRRWSASNKRRKYLGPALQKEQWRKLLSKRVLVGVTISALIVSLGVLGFIYNRRTDSDSRNEAQSPPSVFNEESKEPFSIWTKKLGQKPATPQWPGLLNEGTGLVDPENEDRLVLSSQMPYFVQLGTLQRKDCVMKIRIRQVNWNGATGIFWGHREGSWRGRKAAEIQLIQILKTLRGGERKYILMRVHAILQPDSHKLFPVYIAQSQGIHLDNPDPFLVIHSTGGLITRISYGEVEFPELVTPALKKRFAAFDQGAWGAYNEGGTTWLNDPYLEAAK